MVRVPCRLHDAALQHNMNTYPNDDQVRARIVCPDGFSLSVQASSAHYCTPREDGHPLWHYRELEVGYPLNGQGERVTMPPSWHQYADEPAAGGDSGVFHHVPRAQVHAWLAVHGGTLYVGCPIPEPLSPDEEEELEVLRWLNEQEQEEHEALMERLVDHVQALGFIWVFGSEGRIAFTYADPVSCQTRSPLGLRAPEPSDYRTVGEWLAMTRRDIRDLI